MRVTPALRFARRRTFALAALVALTLVAAVTAMGATTPPPLNYSTYVGGKGKANPNLSTVVIGWINGQGGTIPGTSFPSTSRAAQAVVAMINNELGGVHGHRVRLNQCFIVSAEEEGTECGQQMANDKRVMVVAHGVVVTGNQSEYNVLKGSKPVVMGVSASNADVHAKNV